MQEPNFTSELASIQNMLAKAYTDLHNNLLVAESGGTNPYMLERLLELSEAAVIRLRNLTESVRPPLQISLPEAKPPLTAWSGRLEVTECGWLHLELFSLLPTCHYKTPKLLTDTLSRLLTEYRERGGAIPFFEKALLIIDEHCNIESRQVFDQDNKAWKAIPNALKGIAIADDDQFSLHVCLMSTMESTPRCHIYLMDQTDADSFFALRNGSIYM